jgi:hypothetical protein
MRAIERKDVPVAIEDDNVEIRTSEVGELSVIWAKLKEGTDFAPALVGLPDDLCQCPHWGYMIKGRIKMKTKDGENVYEAGQAFYWAPGHAPLALEDSEYVEFSPTEEFQAVVRHIQGGS